MEPSSAVPADAVYSWSSCCSDQDTSALTRLRNLPSAWKPSLTPEAFHNALGGNGSPGAPTALDSVQKSHFFQYRERDLKSAGWKMLDDLQKEEVQLPDYPTPFAETCERIISGNSPNGNVDRPNNDVSTSSWVLGGEYLKCMDNAEKMIDGMHFFRPSALYNTFGFVRQPSAAPAPSDDETKVLRSYSRRAKELRRLIKVTQASVDSDTPLKAKASLALPALSVPLKGLDFLYRGGGR
mmetsp:Transcript_17408/g.43348  ORF Transcript_17408/g.43348 Transcript_17408/m.43348 type:complete len:239 (-) Transcript_17408:1220-1936(-)